MSDTALHLAGRRLASASCQRDLRARIGWICHALRIAAVLWITWNLAFVVYYWSDKAQILQNYGRLFSVDLGDVSAARYAAAFAAVMVSLAVGAVVVVCIWRLAGTYLAGRVFTVDAALWLRRTDLATRLLLSSATGFASRNLRGFRLRACSYFQGRSGDG